MVSPSELFFYYFSLIEHPTIIKSCYWKLNFPLSWLVTVGPLLVGHFVGRSVITSSYFQFKRFRRITCFFMTKTREIEY